MLYWFVKYGFFFLFASFLMTATFLRMRTFYYYLTAFFFDSSIVILLVSAIFLPYKWKTTDYFLLKNHIYIKEGGSSTPVSYKEIRKIGCCETLLEKILGITNIYIETMSNKNYYLNGIKNDAVVIDLINNITSK